MRLTFHKRSIDGSGKGMFVQTGSDTDELSCVIYELALSCKSELDRVEGLGIGYREQLMSVVADGLAYRPSIYVAASTHINPALVPYHWYKEMVILGANYHRMPDSYIDSIRATTSTQDLNPERAAANERILIAMRDINRSNGCAID
jgi:hypothetical protein